MELAYSFFSLRMPTEAGRGFSVEADFWVAPLRFMALQSGVWSRLNPDSAFEGRRPGDVIARGEALGRGWNECQALQGRHTNRWHGFCPALAGLHPVCEANPGLHPGLSYLAPSALQCGVMSRFTFGRNFGLEHPIAFAIRPIFTAVGGWGCLGRLSGGNDGPAPQPSAAVSLCVGPMGGVVEKAEVGVIESVRIFLKDLPKTPVFWG